MTILSLTLWLPIAAAAVCLLLPRTAANAVKGLGLAASLATFVVSLGIVQRFQEGVAGFQLVELHQWIPRWGITYSLGVDGISLWLVMLTTLLTPVVLLSSWNAIHKHPKEYVVAMLVLESAMIGAFVALDVLLFYIFFELMLLPMYLIIGVWGGANRIYAAIKFFLFTIAGSLLMLLGIIYLAFLVVHRDGQPSFAILSMYGLEIPRATQAWLFGAFALAFAIKVPLFPLHTWLPDAHVEAPTGGSVILAAITLKIGGYGFLRFNLPIAPDASHVLSGFMITLSLIAIVYIGLVALVQADMKKLIAYSSIAHMGFVTLGLFIFTADGMLGGIVQMISHGFISAALFLCVGVLYDRIHSRQIADYGGVANTMPVFAAFFVFFAMANSGLPGTSGFIGEFLVILGTMKVSFWYTFLAATTLITGASYTLWMVKRVVYGEVASPKVAALKDLNARELTFLAILAAAVLALGLYPKPLADVANPTIHQLLQHVEQKKTD